MLWGTSKLFGTVCTSTTETGIGIFIFQLDKNPVNREPARKIRNADFNHLFPRPYFYLRGRIINT